MKIYTKKGDDGTTSLFGGKRVAKSSARIEAYGSVDELNAFIGLILSYSVSGFLSEMLQKIQGQLFVLGADLATPVSTKTRIDRIGEIEIRYLEEKIDRMDEALPKLKNFILPGGCPVGAMLHVARTVCRKAEREVVRCRSEDSIGLEAIRYLNRLSDLLFVAARYENSQAGYPEETWDPKK